MEKKVHDLRTARTTTKATAIKQTKPFCRFQADESSEIISIAALNHFRAPARTPFRLCVSEFEHLCVCNDEYKQQLQWK